MLASMMEQRESLADGRRKSTHIGAWKPGKLTKRFFRLETIGNPDCYATGLNVPR